jgi:outer membrane protein assembly factor BamA
LNFTSIQNLLLAASALGFASIALAEDSPFLNQSTLPAYDSVNQQFALLGSKEVPDYIQLQKNKAVIGKITVKRGNVFDLSKEEENIRLFKLANSLHIITQESVIRNQLLFETGDFFSQQIIEESERILRNTKYLYDAEINLVSYHDNTVDIEIVTRDVWTLTGSINFSREGGANKLSAEIEESNLLGYGKKLKLKTGSNVDRDETLISYSDKQFFGTRSKVSLQYIDKSDGTTQALDFERPFYSLHSKWSFGASYFTDERTDPVYSLGEVINAFGHEEENVSVFFGLSEGYSNQHVYRWRLGFDKEVDIFTPSDDYLGQPVPEDRNYRYPWISLEVYEDRMIKTRHIKQIRRTEDLNLGNEITAKFGWSDHHAQAENEGIIFDVHANMAFKPNRQNLFLLTPYFKGRYSNHAAENTSIGAKTKFYTPVFEDHVFYMALSADYIKNEYLDEQLYLGGDSGLRGYPLRFQSGDRSFLFTMEQRFYTQWHWFQLTYVGALVFFDAGRAWSTDTPENENTRILKDVGFGLRLASSRGSRGLVLHLDVAFPMDGDTDIDNMQLVITTAESF